MCVNWCMRVLPVSELLQQHRKCGGSEGKTKSRMATNKDTVASVTNLRRKPQKKNIGNSFSFDI